MRRISIFSSHRSKYGGLTIGAQRLCMLVDHRLVPRTQAVHDAHLVLRLGREARDLLAFYDGLPGIIENVGEDCRTVATIIFCVRVGFYDVHTNRRLQLTQQIRCLYASTPSQQSPVVALREGSQSRPHVLQTRRTRRTGAKISNWKDSAGMSRTYLLV